VINGEKERREIDIECVCVCVCVREREREREREAAHKIQSQITSFSFLIKRNIFQIFPFFIAKHLENKPMNSFDLLKVRLRLCRLRTRRDKPFINYLNVIRPNVATTLRIMTLIIITLRIKG
jgi:hypothetical protein